MEVYKYLDCRIVDCIENHQYKNDITEIRLRVGAEIGFTINGKTEIQQNIYVTKQCIEDIFYNMCQKSQNIYDNEISNGYITLTGGHRVGIGGEYVYSKTTGKYILKEIKSLNIRLSKKISYFTNQEQLFELSPESTLLIGPPHSGKTSLLKLYTEKLSEDYRVAVCDERKELFSYQINCDVISGINKATAVSMATRTLNPQFIVCDEIGSLQEAEEILSAVNTGVKFICSAHASDISSLKKRPNITVLINNGVFNRIAVLKHREKKFFIEDVFDV